MIDFKAIDAAALSRCPGILTELLGPGSTEGREWRTGSLNGEPGRSFAFNLDTGVWKDFNPENDEGGVGLIALYAHLKHIKNGEAAYAVAPLVGMSTNGSSNSNGTKPAPAQTAKLKKDNWEIVWPVPAELLKPGSTEPLNLPALPNSLRNQVETKGDLHHYLAADGKALMYTARLKRRDNGKKEIRPFSLWRHKATHFHRWIWWFPVGLRPLYHLDHLATHPDLPVLIVGGEKCADSGTAKLPSWVTITWMGGESGAKQAKWAEVEQRQTGFVYWPDNDKAGAQAASVLAEILGDRLRVVIPKLEWRERFDIADLIEEGATTDELEAIVEGAVDVEAFKAEALKRWPDLSSTQASEEAEDTDTGRVRGRDSLLIKEFHKKIWKEAKSGLEEALAENPKSTKTVSDFLPDWDAAFLEKTIMEELGHRFARNHGDELYIYAAGHYGPNGENDIRRLVKAIVIPKGNWTSHMSNEAVERIFVDSAYVLEEVPE